MVQKILILLNLVVAIAGAGLVYYAHNIIKPTPTDAAAEAENLKTSAFDQTQVQAVPIKKFVVNLHSRATRLRYLDLEMNLLTFHADQREIIKANEHIIKDIVVEVASHLDPDELDSITGKILLENRIKKEINKKLGGTQPIVK